MEIKLVSPQENLLKFMAKRAITPSPLRNQYPQGGLIKIRKYLSNTNLKNEFLEKYSSESEYKDFLNFHTKSLMELFPKNQFRWGSARKALNIFLRDLALQFIVKDNPFDESLKHMEIPLDSYVAKGLKTYNPNLPKFVSIKNTRQMEYFLYQSYADELAKQNNTSKVHLDLSFYPVD